MAKDKDKDKDKDAQEAADKAKAEAAEDAKSDGAEGEDGATEDGASKAKKKKKLKIMVFAGLLLLLAGGGAAAYFTGMLGGGKLEEEVGSKKSEVAVYYSMPEMIINLASPGKSASFLKASVILELQNKLDAVTVEANLPRLMDAFNTYVRELRPSDLSGSAGITRLREELLLRANKALEPTKINDVLFKEIVVQ